MPRVIADVAAIAAHVELLGSMDRGRRWQTDALEEALAVFFASGSAFGPRSSDVVGDLGRLWSDTVVDIYGLLATADAFRQAEEAIAVDPFGTWVPDDVWIEQRRRGWLLEHQPEAAHAATATMAAADLIARVHQIDALLADAGAGAGLDPVAVDVLLAERDALIAEAVIAIDGVIDGIDAWHGSDNDPILDRLVRERDDLVELVVASDTVAAAVMQRLLADGVPAAPAYAAAVEEAAYESRVQEVMDVDGLDRDAAVERLRAMDQAIAGLIAAGVDPEEAVMAFAMAEHLELDLVDAQLVAAEGGLTVVEALGRMALAESMDLDVAALDALGGLGEYFDVFDNSRGGDRDGRVSTADLVYVVEHPGQFSEAQVVAARAILVEPLLRNRLDDAAANDDILDTDRFGSADPGDGIISRDDLDAFLQRTQLNHILGAYSVDIDTAHRGDEPDGYFSENDLETWLTDNPAAPVEVRNAVQLMLDGGLVDQSWLERNREALAMGAAVVAGGVVIVVSGGSATPVVLAYGFASGAGAAGLTTIAINELNDESLLDGALQNALTGGFVGLSMAGLPSGWREAMAIRNGFTVGRAGAVAGLAGEVGSIVDNGGIDLVLPDGWEDDVHEIAGLVDDAGGFIADVTSGAEALVDVETGVGD